MSIYLSTYLPIYLSTYLSIYLSICKLENLAIPRDFFIFQSWQHQKRSNSAWLPHFSKLTTSKTKQFCDFLIFEVDNTQKTKQFCETSSFFELDNIQNEAILRDFFNFWTWQHQKQSNSARLPSNMENWVQSWQPRTNAFCDCSSPPVESTAPATKKWCQVIRSAAPVMLNHLSKPEDLMLQNATPLRKSAPSPPNSSDEDVSCIAPATENASLQIFFKCPTPAIVFGNATKPSRFSHFWQGAQSLAPATRNEIWTSKSGPYMVCFVYFDFEMCFAPQRRALFRHLNFQKWSVHGVFCTFWLRNVLRATRACNCSSFIWPDGSGPAALAGLLFDPPEPQIIGRNTVFREFPTFSRICIFFLLTLSLLLSSLFYSSLLSDSSHLCFSSVHIVGSLTSKLPSMIHIIRYWKMDIDAM